MNKTIRIVLYVLSILTVAGVIAAAILTGGQAKPASAPGATAEEEQADMSDAQTTLDGAATADGSGISTDGAETAGEDGSISENAATAGEMEAYQMMQPQQLELGVHQMKQQTRIIKKTPAIQPSS